MSIITFPKLNWNHIYFLFFFIAYFIKQIIKLMTRTIVKDGEVDKVCEQLFFIYVYTISDLFSLFILLVVKIRNKHRRKKLNILNNNINNNKNNNIEKKESSSSINSQDINSVFSEIEKKNMKKKNLFYKGKIPLNETKIFLNIFFISITDLTAQFIFVIFFLIYIDFHTPYFYFTLIFNIFFKYIFSMYFLQLKFNRHHYLSFGINLIGLISLCIIDNIGKNYPKDFVYFLYAILVIFNVCLYSFGNVMGKKALTNNYLLPYTLLLFKGIIELLLLIIFSIPLFFIKTKSGRIAFSGFLIYLNEPIKILKLIALMLSNYIYNFFSWMITDKFSPSHYTMANILEVVAYKLFSIITNIKGYHWTIVEIFYFLTYILLIFGALIHNEVIVINVCSLNKKTKIVMDLEASQDLLEAEKLSEEKQDVNCEMLLRAYSIDDDN